jgi:hypothetical protein
MNPQFAERQPQIVRLRLPQNARQTPLRMTPQLFSEFQIQESRSC